MLRKIKRLLCDHSSGRLIKRYYKLEKVVKIYYNGFEQTEYRVRAIKKYKCRKCGEIYTIVAKSRIRPAEYLLNDFIDELESVGYVNSDWSDE